MRKIKVMFSKADKELTEKSHEASGQYWIRRHKDGKDICRERI